MGKSHQSKESKKRDSNTAYNHKVEKIKKWYEHLEEERKNTYINPNTKQEPKRKELKQLSYYIDKLRKPKAS
jgi:hypothetical protein